MEGWTMPDEPSLDHLRLDLIGARPGNLQDEFDPLAWAKRGEAVRIKIGLTEVKPVQIRRKRTGYDVIELENQWFRGFSRHGSPNDQRQA